MDDCIIGRGHRTKDGYRRMWSHGRHVLAHRIAWELKNGPIPDGLLVLHKCDNPPCVNPDHLYAGTNQDNVDDRTRRGRTGNFKGEAHPTAKLIAEDVKTMRELWSSGLTQKVIAEMFGISQGHLTRILSGKSWGHV